MLSTVVSDFYELLTSRIAPMQQVFAPGEVELLYSNEIPIVLAHLQALIDDVHRRSTMFKVQQSSSRSLCPTEYGLYQKRRCI